MYASEIITDITSDIPFPYLLEPFAKFKLRHYKCEVQELGKLHRYAAVANLSYELDAVCGGRFSLCSSMSAGSRHYRNLDWGVEGLKRWKVFERSGKAGPFRVVGVDGMIGVLTGCAKGRFSISVNADLMDCEFCLTGSPIGVLVRMTLEECRSAKEAIEFFMRKKTMRSSFVHIVSCDGESFVVRASRKPDLLKMSYVTNHNPTLEPEYDEGCEAYKDSYARLCAMKNEGSKTMAKEPVHNELTVQSIVMDSRTGEVSDNVRNAKNMV